MKKREKDERKTERDARKIYDEDSSQNKHKEQQSLGIRCSDPPVTENMCELLLYGQ